MSRRPYAESVRYGPSLRNYEVVTADGNALIVTSHFCFNNAEEGLIFRRYIDDDVSNKTRVVASYASGFWRSYRELED